MPRAATARRAAGSVSLRDMVLVSKAVGHPVRLRMLAMLSRCSLCVCQMAAILELAYPTISGHLTELRRCGLVTEEKRGKVVYNHLNANSPFAGLVTGALMLARKDQIIANDKALVDRVRTVPCSVLTGAGLSLKRVGIVRKVLRSPASARA